MKPGEPSQGKGSPPPTGNASPSDQPNDASPGKSTASEKARDKRDAATARAHTAMRLRRAKAVTARTLTSLLVWSLFAFFILAPLLTVVAVSFAQSILVGVWPLTLEWYQRIFTEKALYFPLIRSFEIAFIVVLVQLVLGTLIAYATVRRRVYGAAALDALANLTIALPSIVVGIALLLYFGPFGPIIALTDLIYGSPISFTYTLWIVVFAHVLETFPYMVRTVGTALQQLPPNLESAARSLGASRFTVMRTIVLPLLRPGLLAGGVLVFARSIAEFGATIVVVSAVLRTAPVRIYAEAEAGFIELAAAQAVILMVVSFGIYVLMRRRLMRYTPEELALDN